MRDRLHPASLCQIEIPSSDLKRSIRFYREAFGWEAAPADLHEYVVLAVPEDCPFGIALVPMSSPPNASPTARRSEGVVLYFAAEDPEAIVRCAEGAGGYKRFGPKVLPGYGVVYQVEDPDGARFGLFRKDQSLPATLGKCRS